MPDVSFVNGLQHFPLGHTFSGSPHSVCVSLPTMRDVIGYEEKDPRVVEALQSGYPRFFENPLISKLNRHLRETNGMACDATLLLCATEGAAQGAISFAGSGDVEVYCEETIFGVSFLASDGRACARAKEYVKRSGCGLSSRVAEAVLFDLGLIDSIYPEVRADANDISEVLDSLSAALDLDSAWMQVTSSGMNAFFATYQAVNALAREAGRKRWVRLGWLYVDTMDIIDEMGDAEYPSIAWADLRDLDGLRARLEPIGHEIAGMIVEVPTNPLFEHVDVPALVRLSRDLGARLVVDPSLVSVWNASDWSGADVLVSSLTKYASGAGDVLSGLVAINPQQEGAECLRSEIFRRLIPLSAPDTERLATQIREAPNLIAHVNRTLPEVVDYLRGHPRVERVWCPDSAAEGVFKGLGAVCSFVVKGEMQKFYDTIQMAKGPSFGTNFSLISPYMWLAHYEIVSTKALPVGEHVGSAANYPDLLRLSVGLEGADAIISALEQAFDQLNG